jgi:molecular chaperone DnaJ
VDAGQSVRVRGEGNVGANGGTNGDLLVEIYIKRHAIFTREDFDVLCEVPITFTQAALGAEIEVPTIDGKARIKIAAGTHAGKVLRLRGKGLPDVNGYGRGDIMVVVDITIPDELTKEERNLVEKLAEQPNFKQASGVENQNIFERMKNFFR